MPTSRRAAFWLLIILASLPGAPAGASCVPVADRSLRSLDEGILVDPLAAIHRAGAALAAAPADAGGRMQRAQLQAILAESYDRLERQVEAREAASRGLAELADRPDTDPLKSRLLISRLSATETRDGIAQSIVAATRLLKELPERSLQHACARLARARLNEAQNRLDLAVADALTTYREARANGWPELSALAAEALGTLFADSEDLDEARHYLDEALGYAASLRATDWMSVLYYDYARVDLRAGKYTAVAAEIRQSSILGQAVGDLRGLSMNRIISCIAYTRSGDLTRAQPECEAAENELRASDRPDLLKMAMAAHASLDLAMHRPSSAVARLNKVLDHDGADIERACWRNSCWIAHRPSPNSATTVWRLPT